MMRRPAPVLASATGGYEERPPIESLGEHLSCTWFNTVADGTTRIAVVPDGCIDLEWIDGELRVAGADREVVCESLRPRTTVIGFRFRPGAASRWLRVSATEIAGARVPLDAFWGAEARSIAEWAGCAPDRAGIARRLEVALARHAKRVRPPDPMAYWIRRVLELAPLQTDPVPRLCAELRTSERSLRRRCHEEFGYGPKTLQRIVRFQRFLQRAHEPTALASLARSAGYADQAHLTRDARRMAAMTPMAIREQRDALRMSAMTPTALPEHLAR